MASLPPRLNLKRLALVLPAIYLASALLFQLCGPAYLQALTSLSRQLIDMTGGRFNVLSAACVDRGRGEQITYRIAVLEEVDVPMVGRGRIQRGIVTTQVNGRTVYLYPIVLLVFLACRPGLTLRQRLMGALMGAPMVVAAALLDITVNVSATAPAPGRAGPGLLSQTGLLMLNNGGRHVMAFVVCMALYWRLCPRIQITAAASGTARNRACPCDSGKKHKHCCLPGSKHS
ncbi:MAG: SEC-C domain-containing protein [Deltaproteobacteria bacterium]|nr:SEC-C domain-containing protein [Deltaproteobacteria bacterium]